MSKINQCATIKSEYPFEIKQMSYSDVEMEQFKKEAENWRIVHLPQKVEGFNGDYAKLFKTAKIGRNNIIPISPENYLIKNGELVGTRITCGTFDINGGMGGWRSHEVSLYFDKYNEIINNSKEYCYSVTTRDSNTTYYSIILPVSIIESFSDFIADSIGLVDYFSDDCETIEDYYRYRN